MFAAPSERPSLFFAFHFSESPAVNDRMDGWIYSFRYTNLFQKYKKSYGILVEHINFIHIEKWKSEIAKCWTRIGKRRAPTNDEDRLNNI